MIIFELVQKENFVVIIRVFFVFGRILMFYFFQLYRKRILEISFYIDDIFMLQMCKNFLDEFIIEKECYFYSFLMFEFFNVGFKEDNKFIIK